MKKLLFLFTGYLILKYASERNGIFISQKNICEEIFICQNDIAKIYFPAQKN